ncbi:hypothetical protein MMC11_004713 [Xylographa trunciseda]|nr:hypothetical protein [Xylographa trunciseda]
MRQLVEANSTADDWTGTTDKAVRRKRQNRLNQRAHRRRRTHPVELTSGRKSIFTATLVLPPDTPHASPELPQVATARTLQVPERSSDHHPLDRHDQAPACPTEGAVFRIPYPLPVSLDPSVDIGLPKPLSTVLSDLPTGSPPLFSHLQRASDPSSSNAAIVMASNHFPLSCDNLLTLVQFNVLRAIITNISLLRLTSVFFPSPSAPPAVPPSPSLIPPPLRPTPLQLSTPHLPWIDIFPHPVVRDNLIRAGSAIDNHDMCLDIVGEVCGGSGPCEVLGMEWDASKVVVREKDDGEPEKELRGVLVWADPWDACNWELTEGFLRKWGWMVRGATDLIEASNEWREKRGEDRLVVEL